jgi:basic membrane protein A and related proteins
MPPSIYFLLVTVPFVVQNANSLANDLSINWEIYTGRVSKTYFMEDPMENRFFQIVSIAILTSITLAGCSDRNNNVSASDNEENFKIGIVMSKTEINDRGFNQTVWEGVEQTAKKHKWKEKKNYLKANPNPGKDFEKQLQKFSKENYNIIFGIGYSFEDSMKKIASEQKKSNFVIFDGIVEKPNVVSVTYREEQSSFLAGIVAGMQTKSLKVGFIGGIKDEFIERFEYGFRAGVMSIDPKIKVLTKYSDTFDKPEEGSKMAAELYKNGADIIFQAAGKTGLGVFDEAKKLKKNGKNVWVIGVDRDQYDVGMPENITLTSAIKRIDKGVDEVITKSFKGNFRGGRILRYGIKENGVGLSKSHKNLSKDTITQVKLYKENIKTGNIVVPASKKEFKNFSPKKPKKEETPKKKFLK